MAHSKRTAYLSIICTKAELTQALRHAFEIPEGYALSTLTANRGTFNLYDLEDETKMEITLRREEPFA